MHAFVNAHSIQNKLKYGKRYYTPKGTAMH
jgi:hypothetical protein